MSCPTQQTGALGHRHPPPKNPSHPLPTACHLLRVLGARWHVSGAITPWCSGWHRMLVVHEDVLGATRVPQGCSRCQRMLWVPGDDLGYHEILWAPGDAPDPRRTPGAGGHRRKPERAQMPPSCPSCTAGITTSTSADVSKPLISSDRATALSLLGPRGGWGLVTKGPLLPSTHHPGAWCCRGGAETLPKGLFHPLGCPLGMRGTWLRPGRGPNPSHRLCRAGVY